MAKRYAIITNQKNNMPLLPYFFELTAHGYEFYYLSNDDSLAKSCREKNWYYRKTCLAFCFKTNYSILILPVMLAMAFYHAIFLKLSKKINGIICFNFSEKIAYTPIAALFGLKIIWIENIDADNAGVSGLKKKMLRLLSRNAKIITLSNHKKNDMVSIGVDKENISNVYPGINLNNYQRQETIYYNIAKTESRFKHKKFFTIGTVADADCRRNIEAIMGAVKSSLTVAPDLQLIIVGGGGDRKAYVWLAKKMELDNLVWFVGEQLYLRKWLDSFDIFIASAQTARISDIQTTLAAAWAGLPVIAPRNNGYEEFISKASDDFLIDEYSSEKLAEKIIRLYKNTSLRLEIGRQSQKMVEEFFRLDIMLNNLKTIL